MAKFSNIFETPAKTSNGGGISGKFSGIFAEQPKVEKPTIPFEQPSKLTQITGEIQEAIGGEGKTLGERILGVGKTIGKAIVGTTKAVVTNPVEAVGGVEKGLRNFVFNVAKGTAGIVGADKAQKYIQENQDAINQIFESNLKDKDEKTASSVGNFVGEQIPYVLAGVGATAVGTKLAAGAVGAYGTGLSIKAVETIGKITNWASDVAGFTGAHQLVFTEEEGSRMDALKSDLLVLSALGAIGLAGSSIKNAKMKANIRKFVSEVPNKSVSELEVETKKLLDDIKVSTGKEPKELAAETLNQYPIDLKTIPRTTKMGDLAKVAESRGFPEYGKTEFKPTAKEEATQLKKVLTEGNVQQVAGKTEQFGGKVSKAWEKGTQDLDLTAQELDNLGYAGVTKDKAIQSGVDVVNSDAEKAYRIAVGLERSPADTTNNIVNKLLIRKAKQEGNLALQAELTLNRLKTNSRRGQEIWSEQLLKSGRAKETPEFNMSKILEERTKILERKTKIPVKQTVEKEIQSFKSKVKTVTRADVEQFITNITC